MTYDYYAPELTQYPSFGNIVLPSRTCTEHVVVIITSTQIMYTLYMLVVLHTCVALCARQLVLGVNLAVCHTCPLKICHRAKLVISLSLISEYMLYYGVKQPTKECILSCYQKVFITPSGKDYRSSGTTNTSILPCHFVQQKKKYFFEQKKSLFSFDILMFTCTYCTKM